jgi:hypothetical protein
MNQLLQENRPELIDPREAAVITEAKFFEPYKEELRELFTALGREDRWSEDPREMLEYIRTGWIGAEHGNSGAKDQFAPEQEAAALPIFERLGLSGETLPPAGMHFADALVVGGTTQANYRREQVVHRAQGERGITMDRITLWVGQRPKEQRDGIQDELLSPGGRFAGNDIMGNPWVQHQLGSREWDAFDPWESRFATETDLGRVTMLKQVPGGGNLQPHRIDLSLTDVRDLNQRLPEKRPDAPVRLTTDYRFTSQGGQEIVIMNAAAVSRGEGRPSRHTTASSAIEWLERHAPPENARVLFVSSNPHTLRTAQDVYQILQERGRGDIQLVVAGASAPPNAPIQLFLGEVGRLIDNDVRRNYPPTEQNGLGAQEVLR